MLCFLKLLVITDFLNLLSIAENKLHNNYIYINNVLYKIIFIMFDIKIIKI